MLVAGYDAHLYCDVCESIGERTCAQFTGETRRECLLEARAVGWKISEPHLCPLHHKASQLSATQRKALECAVSGNVGDYAFGQGRSAHGAVGQVALSLVKLGFLNDEHKVTDKGHRAIHYFKWERRGKL